MSLQAEHMLVLASLERLRSRELQIQHSLQPFFGGEFADHICNLLPTSLSNLSDFEIRNPALKTQMRARYPPEVVTEILEDVTLFVLSMGGFSSNPAALYVGLVDASKQVRSLLARKRDRGLKRKRAWGMQGRARELDGGDRTGIRRLFQGDLEQGYKDQDGRSSTGGLSQHAIVEGEGTGHSINPGLWRRAR